MAGSLTFIGFWQLMYAEIEGRSSVYELKPRIFRGAVRFELPDFVVLIESVQLLLNLWESENVAFWSNFHFFSLIKVP
jgi:hypothetical protein